MTHGHWQRTKRSSHGNNLWKERKACKERKKKAERKEGWHGFCAKLFISCLKVLLFTEIMTRGGVRISDAALHLGCRQDLGYGVSEHPCSCTAYPVLSITAPLPGSWSTETQYLLVPMIEDTIDLFQPLLIHSLPTFSTSHARVLTTRLLYSPSPGHNWFTVWFFFRNGFDSIKYGNF